MQRQSGAEECVLQGALHLEQGGDMLISQAVLPKLDVFTPLASSM